MMTIWIGSPLNNNEGVWN